MSHDTPCHYRVALTGEKGIIHNTGTPENKNINFCVWSKVNGVLDQLRSIPAAAVQDMLTGTRTEI